MPRPSELFERTVKCPTRVLQRRAGSVGLNGALAQKRCVVQGVAGADVRLRGALGGSLPEGFVEQPVLQWGGGDDRVDRADGLHVRLLPLSRQVPDLFLQQLEHETLDLLVLNPVEALQDEGSLAVATRKRTQKSVLRRAGTWC